MRTVRRNAYNYDLLLLSHFLTKKNGNSFDINEKDFPKLVEAASFKEMKRKADDLAPVADAKLWKSNKQFFANGRSGQWQKRWSKENLARFNDLCRNYTSDYITWLLEKKN